MAQVSCKRCGATNAGLDAAPLPGAAGQLVYAHTCNSCWEIWRGEQVKLLNEHRLSPANPEHYAFLVQQMKDFLRLA